MAKFLGFAQDDRSFQEYTRSVRKFSRDFGLSWLDRFDEILPLSNEWTGSLRAG
jgi:hypothetical protein